MLWFFIVLRIVSNPLSNVFQKVLTRRAADSLFVIAATHAILTLAVLPLLLILPLPERAFWPQIALCAALAVAGNALIVQALRLADLSILGPINAYKSVVSLLPGLIFLGEVPRPLGMAGIALIVAGSYCLVDRAASARIGLKALFDNRGVQFRIGGLVLSATEAVFLKRAAQLSTPLVTFTWWCIVGLAASAIFVSLLLKPPRLRHEAAVLRTVFPTYITLALTTGLMQLATLFTLAKVQVGYTLALFQTSTLLTVLLGWKVFNEPHPARRLIGSAIMIAGATLILLA